jgi:Chagasin family peptidase inhibitor I42
VPELALKVGELYEVELRGLGTAGFGWEAGVEGPEGVVEVRRASSGALPALASPGGQAPDSGSLPEAFHVEAVGRGRVLVRFTLARAWEQGVPPAEELDLDVTVSA